MANLNLYKFFCCVAEEKNISKASEKLFVSQPAVSFSIRELERELGQQLFVRKSKGVELTTFGKLLYNQVKPSVDAMGQVEVLAERFGKLKQGIIRIGACTSNVNQILIDYLTNFALAYPNIQITMERGSKEKLIERLRDNALDMIFIDKTNRIDDFVLVKQFNVEYQLIGSKKFKDKYPNEDIDLTSFPVEDIILPSVNNNSRVTIDKFFANHQIKLMPKYELDNYILLYEFVRRGFGIAFVNIEYYRQAVENGDVYVIYPNFSVMARQIVCLVNPDAENPALQKLIGMIKK